MASQIQITWLVLLALFVALTLQAPADESAGVKETDTGAGAKEKVDVDDKKKEVDGGGHANGGGAGSGLGGKDPFGNFMSTFKDLPGFDKFWDRAEPLYKMYLNR